MIVYRPTIDGVSTLPEIEHITVMYGVGRMESSLLLKYVMFLEIGVKKLGFESEKGLDFLKSENATRTVKV